MKYYVFGAMAATLWACSSQVKIDLKSEIANLMTVAMAYQDAAKNMDVEKLVSFYTKDAKVIPPGGELIMGTEAIRKYMAGIKEMKNFQVIFQMPEINISETGGMGYSLSNIKLSFEDADGKFVKEEGRDFHVWKKIDDEWKLAVDIWNAPPALDDNPSEKK
jgi:ketosteroid isomerase-like protein